MPAETLLEFPCQFPIKAMGLAERDIAALFLDILQRHQVVLAPEQVRQRASTNGKWLSVTVVVQAQSKQQLDAIYQELTAHEAIVYAL
ncbi:transcriptional regulator [Rhabdochromatium marinum]|nr:transcriptional regulator [Rhabdochromatium marinum]